MSELFLDTELQEFRLLDIANTLAESPYSIDDLETILYREVYPVLIGNLWCGEWQGIDRDWLETEILRHSRHKWSFAKLLQFNRGLIRDDWNRVKEFYAEKRHK